jgi:membrane-associated phospholipid phosphatase
MTRHRTVFALTLSATITTFALPGNALAQDLAVSPVAAPSSVTASQGDALSLGRVVQSAFTDLTRLPSIETATILGIGGMGAAIGHAWDNQTSRRLSSSADLGRVVDAGSTIGSMQVQAAAAFGTYALGRLTHHQTVTTVGADLIRAQLVAQVTTQGLKFAVGRTRPDGTTLSFPSGHTASAFATATVLQRNLGWKVGIPAYAMASYVGVARIQDKRHFLSDVAFGAAVGIVAGRTVTVGSGSAKFAVAPSVAPGGGGVNLTWVGGH